MSTHNKAANTDKCACGGNPMVDTDTMTNATFIECDTCHRMCGGLSPHDASIMRNAACARIAIAERAN